MTTSAMPQGSANWPYHEDVRWLRTSALHRLLAAAIAFGLLWFFVQASWLEIISLKAWSGTLALVGLSLLALLIERRLGVLPAACTSVAAVSAAVLLAAWAYSRPSVLALLALPVGMASLLIGSYAGFVAAAAIGLGLAVGVLAPAAPLIPPPEAGIAAMSAALTALLLWVATSPLRMTLQWSWASYERAQRQTEQLRENRGRLAGTLKDLDAAYHRLELMAAELERARRAAVEARRLKAEFAANVSHELRTPLNLIIGFSELMALTPEVYQQPLPRAYRDDVQAIYHNARHLSKLIDDVLDLSQIEAGRMGLAREPVSLSEVVAEAVAAVRGLLENRGLSLTVDVAADLPRVEADPTRVRQVLINLLNNAARFTDSGGVTVRARADENDVTVAVADTGTGIAQEDLPKIFEAFRQLDGSLRRRVGGSGLGLAISREFVELHGGRIWAESALGQGAVFYFALPLREELALHPLRAQSETWARPRATGQEGKRVLLLAEEEDAGRLLRRYLGGLQLVPAADWEQARDLAAREPVQGALVAVRTGAQLWRAAMRAGRTLPDLPLMVCALHRPPALARLPAVASYLVKPVTQERLFAALSALGDGVRSLLIVDDDPEVVRLLGRMARLAPRRYRVQSAHGGAEALEVMRRRRPGAVILDLLMPEVDGYAVLEEMQADHRLRDVPVIIVTAKGKVEETITSEVVAITRRDGLSVFVIMSLWGVGGSMVLYLAALQGVPTELYEAAQIDGAGSWRRFLGVTIPMISPTILFNLVMGFINTFQTFTTSYVMTSGGPQNASLFYGLYLYRNAFRYSKMGYACALAWALFALILVMSVLLLRSSSMWVYYETGGEGI